MRLRHLVFALCAFSAGLLIDCTAPGFGAHAAQNPELSAHVGENEDGTSRSEALAIKRLDIDVTVDGDTSHTVVTASFANSGSQALEGNFVFDMPPGSVVTGYALDIGGKMIDGVLVGRRQAKLVYEERVRHGIDPGLAEVTRAGAFMTRVFPILPGAGRTVRLAFDTPLDHALSIPLSTEKEVGVTAIRVHGAPSAKLEGATWSKGGDGLSAGFENRALGGTLVVAAAPAPALSLSTHSSGDMFFEINDAAPAPAAHTAPARVRIYWDSSRSRRERDLKGEIALLARYVDSVHPALLDLVLFSDTSATRTFKAPKGAEIAAALDKVDYRGATSIAPLLKAGAPDSDVCLLFSDGEMTMDPWHVALLDCPLFAVTGARDADRGFLRAIAERNGGDFADLTVQDQNSALARLLSEAPRVLDVTDAKGHSLDFAVLPSNGARFRVVGRVPESGGIVVKLAHAREKTRVYAVDRAKAHDGDAPAALWAAGRLDAMGATDRPDRDAMLALARRYSVAGQVADFAVFENIPDYIDAEVEPPQSLGKDAIKRYRELADRVAKDKASAQEQRLDRIVSLWDEQKKWWNSEFKPAPRPKAPKTRAMGGAEIPSVDMQASVASPMAGAPPPPPPPPPPQSRAANSNRVETVVVTGARVVQPGVYSASPVTPTSNQDIKYEGTVNTEGLMNNLPRQSSEQDAGPAISTQIAKWNPDRPYLKALEAAKPAAFWDVYKVLEMEHGTTPAFYFDVGEWLFRHGRTADAIAVALNAADLPSADTTTLTILADRLMRYGEETRAIWLYERIAFLEPDRPQPKRNLALALIERTERDAKRGGSKDAERADYAHALDLLADVVLHEWDVKYDGIEVISLMEANHVIPKLKALGGGAKLPLDPRLVALLDVDLRVTLEWNTDETDMDLWVDEPTGERAIFSNPKTAIGGRLSNDMTNGYGPEEYLLHKAPDGTYTVRVNVYATDRINPNGATTVRARIFRNWGRAGEEQQQIELELKRDADGAKLVGTVKVARKK